MGAQQVVVIGAGMGGLAAAIDLARAGHAVTVFDAGHEPGGKMRTQEVAGQPIDAGPTVITMKWVFDALFHDAGSDFDRAVVLHRAPVLARHAWDNGPTLDLHADRAASQDAIARFAGPNEAQAFGRFCAEAGRIHDALRDTFMTVQRPGVARLVARLAARDPGVLAMLGPFSTLWGRLGRIFADPRLRQLFARYATYCGSSPLAAPATLMLIAHVEQEGVWQARGGMIAIARAIGALAAQLGVSVRSGVSVTRIHHRAGRVEGVLTDDGVHHRAQVVVHAGDHGALKGLLHEGRTGHPERGQRSLSAYTWCATARVRGADLAHHTVFFGQDYPAEFRAIVGQGTVCDDPTVYVCAQDRGEAHAAAGGPDRSERLFVLVKGPPANARLPHPQAIWERVLTRLGACGASLDVEAITATGPEDFAARFAGSQGALYGMATHGPWASFRRPAARGPLGGLYLAGASVHPGAGIPMATLSGRLCASAVLDDLAHRA